MIKSDKGPAMRALATKIKVRNHPIMVEGPPEYEPQAKSLVERCVQTLKGIFRVSRCALDARTRAGRPSGADMDGQTRSVHTQPLPSRPRQAYALGKGSGKEVRHSSHRVWRTCHIHDAQQPQPGTPAGVWRVEWIGDTQAGVVNRHARWHSARVDV